MSSIEFQSKDRSVKVSGREYALIRVLAHDMAVSAVKKRGNSGGYEWLSGAVLDEPARQYENPGDIDDLFGVASERRFRLEGHEIETFALVLNTAIVAGSPVIAVLAQVAYTCEIHGYIEASNASWFADLLQQGLHDHVIRPNLGWEDVIGLAREVAAGHDEDPMVMSYSVTGGFPNRKIAEGFDEDVNKELLDERWYSLPEKEQWDLAVKGLRARQSVLAIGPENARRRFGSGHTAFDLRALYCR